MAPIGTGNPELTDRNKRERERYLLMSDTIDKLRAQLKINTRYQTPILEQTLAALIQLKQENKAKKQQLEQLCAELGLPHPAERSVRPEDQRATVPYSQSKAVQQLHRPMANFQMRTPQPAWILPNGRIVAAAVPPLPQQMRSAAVHPPALMNPMLLQGYQNSFQQQLLMQAMLAQGALGTPRIL